MNVKDCRGDIIDPIRFRDTSGLTASNIADSLKQLASQENVPAKVWTDTVKSGGLFGTTYSCVMVAHPDPPQEYFRQMIIINGDTLSFKFWGNSKANYNRNYKAELNKRGSLTAMIRGAFINDDEMALQTEQTWHASIIDLVKSMIHD